MSAVVTPTDRLPSLWRVSLARVGLELRLFSRTREAVVFMFAFPLLLLVIFGSVFSNDLAEGVSFRQYFTAGMIASGIVLSSFQTLAISIAMERDDGTLKRLRGTPMPPGAYFLGKIGMVFVVSLVQVILLLGIGALMFGLDLPATPTLWLRLVWIFVLGVGAGTVLGIAFSSLPRTGRSAPAVVSPVVILLQFVSGVFFVYAELPSWMQTLGGLFPLKWLAQGMRSVFLPDAFATAEVTGSWEIGKVAIVLGAWAVLGFLVCLRTFRWLPRDDG